MPMNPQEKSRFIAFCQNNPVDLKVTEAISAWVDACVTELGGEQFFHAMTLMQISSRLGDVDSLRRKAFDTYQAAMDAAYAHNMKAFESMEAYRRSMLQD